MTFCTWDLKIFIWFCKDKMAEFWFTPALCRLYFPWVTSTFQIMLTRKHWLIGKYKNLTKLCFFYSLSCSSTDTFDTFFFLIHSSSWLHAHLCRLCKAMGGAEKVEIEYGNHSLSNRVVEAVEAIMSFVKREGPSGWDDPWN